MELLFEQLPPDFDEQWLSRELKRRERQRALVEAALADRVIKSYNAFGAPQLGAARAFVRRLFR